MEEVLQFLSAYWPLLLSVLGQLIACVVTIVKLVRKNRDLKLGSGAVQLIMEDLPKLITLAEKINGLDGKAKKDYVMREVQLKLSAMGVQITEEDLLTLSGMVDSLVELSKAINLHGSTKSLTEAKEGSTAGTIDTYTLVG